MIKAICFDLDWVYFTEEWKKWFHKDLVDLVGDESLVEEFLYKSQEMKNLCNGSVWPKDFWETWKKLLKLDISLDQFSQMWIKHYEINSSVKDLIDWLRNDTYKVCTCTNNNPIRVNALDEKFSFKNDFDAFVSSHEVWVFKPDQRIFQKLVDVLWVNANEIVYTDDREDRLSWAKELGIHTYLFDNLDGYKSYLKNLWVKIDL